MLFGVNRSSVRIHGNFLGHLVSPFFNRIVIQSRRKRQSLMNSHRQSRWITSDLDIDNDKDEPDKAHDIIDMFLFLSECNKN